MVLEMAMLAILLVSVKSLVRSFFLSFDHLCLWSTGLSEGSLV